MQRQANIIDTEHIHTMIGDDESSLNEFWEAAIISFKEYRDEYTKHMGNRDLKNLRKSGHRVKPAAQMLGLHEIVTEYEKAKKLLEHHAEDKKIQSSIARVQKICNQALKEFEGRINRN